MNQCRYLLVAVLVCVAQATPKHGGHHGDGFNGPAFVTGLQSEHTNKYFVSSNHTTSIY